MKRFIVVLAAGMVLVAGAAQARNWIGSYEEGGSNALSERDSSGRIVAWKSPFPQPSDEGRGGGDVGQ